MIETMPSPIAALRASLSSASLLGFTARTGTTGGVPQAKPAFVGSIAITVTSAADSGAGTLRDALAQNQIDGGFTTITFSPSLAGSTIALQSPLTVTNSATIDGGSNNITISGGNAVTDFVVNGSNVSISNLTIADGKGTGSAGAPGNSASASTLNGGPGGDAAGGIFVQSGTLGVGGVKFINDTATGGQGGAGAATFLPGQGLAFGSGGAAGNAAGAVYVEPGATVNASNLSSYNDTAQAGAPGSGSGISGAGTSYPVSNNSAVTSNDTALSAPCYCTGTLILTARGDVAVEDLANGDVAVTASGAHRPIRWIGSRLTTCRRHLRPHEVMPVRIAAHAFGENRPARDLRVSPGHPVLVGAEIDGAGGYLVPIMCLINGTTIERMATDEVTYWHIELDQHDILLAEGLPAESYIDLGSRPWFDGADGALYNPDMALPGMPGRCRPVAIDGPVVDAERQRLDGVFAQTLQDQCDWSSDLDQMTC